MKLPHLLTLPLVLALGVCFGAGCSGSDGEISVEASASPLTAQGNDALFTIKLVAARDTGYSLDGLVVKVTPDGKDAITVSCTPADTNGNKMLDKDETLSCVEGAENVLGTDLAGKEIDVELFAQIDGSEERVGDAVWTAAK